MTTEVYLDEQRLRKMVNDAVFAAEFPFLKTLVSRVKRGCGGCGRKQTITPMPDLEGIKQAFANMSNERKIKLKQLLGNATVILKYRKPGGQLVKLKF